jgi:hypothetical protein
MAKYGLLMAIGENILILIKYFIAHSISKTVLMISVNREL